MKDIRKSSTLDLFFDQYQRYKMVQEIIDSFREGEPLKILDVGGYPGQILDFLPDDDVLVIDIVEAEKPNYMRADALNLPFEDNSFDIVLSTDVFEHIEPAQRGRFLSEQKRVSRKALILAGPFETPDIDLFERIANSFYKGISGEDYIWLKEHIENGLPALDATVAELSGAYPNVSVFSNGYLPRWLKMIIVYLNFWNDDLLKPYLTSLNRFYNEKFYPYDKKPPCYRKVIVASRTEVRFRPEEKKEDKISAGNEIVLNGLIENMQKVYLRRSLEKEIRGKDEKLNLCLAEIKGKEEIIINSEAKLREYYSLLEGKEEAYRKKCEELIELDNHFKAKCVEVVSREKELTSLLEEKTGIAGELKEKEERIAALEGSVKEKDSLIKEKEKEINQQKTEIKEKEGSIVNLKKELEEKDHAFRNKCEELIELDRQFKIKCVEVVSKEKELVSLLEEKTGIAGELKEKKERIAALESSVREKQHKIESLDSDTEDMKKKLIGKVDAYSALEKELDKTERELREKEETIGRLLGSMSWKITSPFRTLKDLLRK